MKVKQLMISIASLGLLVGCSSTSTTSVSSESEYQDTTAIEMTTVSLDAGELVGLHEDDTFSFRGIPYAKAERFKSPQAITEYEGGKQLALSYGEVAPQDRTLAANGVKNANEFMTPSNGTADMVGNEDCQYLNVWSTDLSGKKPVLVFFHGGGLSNGASSELSYYTGEYFVETEDAVFVSVNHRLNVLGYLDLSSYDDEYDTSANVGIEDCVVALQWVQDNIAKFGGDPDNVTILGQSGGGVKVTTLACMSDTVDLFDKVFMMSGGYSTTTTTDSQENTKLLVDYLKLKDDDVVSTLTSMGYEDLYNAAVNAGCSWNTTYGVGTFESPLFDENGVMNEYAAKRTWIVGTTYSEFSDSGNGLIYGQNKDNYLPDITDEDATEKLEEMYGDKVTDIAEAFKKAYPQKSLGEALFLNAMPSGGLARYGLINSENGILKMMNDNDATVYNYVVAYKMPYFGGLTMHHTGDMPYWFNALKEVDYQVKGDESHAYPLAQQMADALASFIANGNPSTDSLEWEAYTNDQHNTMVFDSTSECKVDFDTELYALMMSE